MPETRTVRELQEEWQSLRSRMQDINDTAEAAGRTALTEEENQRWNDLSARAEVVRRSLQLALMSDNPAVRDEMRSAITVLPVEHRLTPVRAAAGAKFRAMFADTNRSAAEVELRDLVSATASTDVTSAVPVFVQDFVEPLEKGLIFGLVGQRILTGLSGDISYPIAPYVVATIAKEKEKIADTTITLDGLRPKPQRIGIVVPMTGYANIKTDGALYNWVVAEVVKAVARSLNRWMFMATPISEGVYGAFAYNASANPIQEKGFSGALPTYKELLDMRGKVMSTGAYNDGTYAYVMSGAMHAALEATPISTGSDRMILENGKIGGVPVFITEEIEYIGEEKYNATAKHVGFGRFSDCMSHQFGGMKLLVDPYTNGDADITRVLLNTMWSVDLIRAKSFVIGTVANG